MLYLPRNLGCLATLASKQGGRFMTDCLRVLDPGDGTYRVEATDGKRLAIVRGRGDAADYVALADAEDVGGEARAPARQWKEAFAKLGDKRRPVGLGLRGEELVLAVGDQA